MDYYAILGLHRGSTQADIESQHQRLAQANVPGVNPGDEPNAATRLLKINEAYLVLSDPDRRREYDAGKEPGQSLLTPRPSPDAPAAGSYVWTKPPAEGIPRSALAPFAAIVGIVAAIGVSFLIRASIHGPYPQPILVHSAAGIQTQLDNPSPVAAPQVEDPLFDRYSAVSASAKRMISIGDSAFASVSGEAIDGSTPMGQARQQRINQLDRDLQSLRTADKVLDGEGHVFTSTRTGLSSTDHDRILAELGAVSTLVSRINNDIYGTSNQ